MLTLPALRPGGDYFEGESRSLVCLELLLNQRVGVERATAAALAIHDYFARPFEGRTDKIACVTRWPYTDTSIRGPARAVFNVLAARIGRDSAGEVEVGSLDSAAVGAMASLERYFNRTNTFFDPLRNVVLTPEQLRTLDPATVQEISGIRLPAATLAQQLASAAAVLELACGAVPRSNLREKLLELPRVGPETADALLVYAFQEPALIVDAYLRRVAYRHHLLDDERAPRRAIEESMARWVSSWSAAFALHARVNELGVMYCFARNPACDSCPLGGIGPAPRS